MHLKTALERGAVLVIISLTARRLDDRALAEAGNDLVGFGLYEKPLNSLV